MSNLKVHVLRLKPGEDVVEKLQHYMTQCAPRGVFVMTCCGSVTSATLRLAANTENVTNKVVKYRGHYEVLSLSGTISRGGLHLHICLGDHNGATVGGHVMGDLTVFTTMEVVLGEALDTIMDRSHDPDTGFDELTITKE
ncbi:hypothetical protein Pmani_013738 [Petrolisthes manimaculis]|uniref:PPC domain-containing protein n=1 Tax=Petrolisthes manimaculis TaxID=1843537 RepID=A0AAE1PWX6_9EUCA|nr:hypothetical protein Pmani_013738 [Petrolisthes manimaculis]